jgi:asparagine synthase (glutamine-hydrolysing)
MCGLVATVSFDGRPADPGLLKRASDVLTHRGPDDSGIATYGPVGFGFRRLSIIDLSPAGHQPMESADGRLAIVFNGEIYNYIELKRELQQLGHTFQSSSDTEVLLHAYDAWGVDCVNRFNGMWAFVIYDKERGRLVGSRDRFGVKPLYRWSDGTRTILASEIKAIVASGWYTPDINWTTAARFLGHGHLDQDTQTFYAGIDQLAAGSTLEIDLSGRMKERRFWSIAALQDPPPEDPVAVFRETFEDSVRLRMRSDVPVGVCLSGGIDSNAIISMMADLRRGTVAYPLQAFSYIPEEFSEAEYINQSIARTGAVLNELHTDPRELWDILPRAIWHYDEPVHSPTALIGYQLMRLAKQRGVTVVLNGQGADEVNAGYHAYFRAHWSDLMHAGRWGLAIREVREYGRSNAQPYGRLLRSTINHWLRREVRRAPGFALMRDPLSTKAVENLSWLSQDLQSKIPPLDTDAWSLPLSGVLEHSVERRPLPLYLRVEDRNSMAHSVEARLPFLDYRLVSLAFSLPGEWKLRGGWNKYLVREALKGVIAEPVRTRTDKMGFPTPSKDWWARDWYEPMMDLLGSRTLRDSGICDPESARADLARHVRGEVDVASQLFRLAEFVTWLDANGADGVQRPGSHEGLAGAMNPPATPAFAGTIPGGNRHG